MPPLLLEGDPGHSGLADHYENSHWGQQPSYRSEANCGWDKVTLDRTDQEVWPSIPVTETESASECPADTDSASTCGSENSSMATGSTQGSFTGHPKKTNGNNGTNGALVQSPSNQSALGAGGTNGNGGVARVWGVATGSSSGLTHCSVGGGDGKMDNMIGDGRSQNCWGASNSNAGINLNLNPNANPAAWPVLGHEGTVATGNPSSICSPVSAIGQNMGSQNGNPVGTVGAWGNLLPQESTEPQTSTCQNVSFSVQPQNLNTDGSNNTNPMNSSPNPINAMQTNGLPNWGMAVGMGAIIPPHLQGLPGANGSSVSQGSGSGGEGMGSSVWGLSPGNPATGNNNSGFSQGNGDTVNSALSAKQNGSSSAVQKEGNGGNAWDSGPPAGPGILAWGRGSGNNGIGNIHSGAWGHPSRSSSNASKSMQEGWGSGGDEMNLGASQWEDEDGDMWNNGVSQEGSSSCSSWGNASKKGLQKGMKTPGKQDEAWIMSRLIKQLTDMGFPREPAEEALKSNSMNLDQAMSALLEKKVDMDKRGLGMTDYNGMVTKTLGCRPPISKESSMDRPTFLDKVQAQLLQFAAKNIGLSPALLTSPINPQHMTMLNQLYQLQLAYQRLQIQQQMLQAQRNVSGPMRQQEQQTKEQQSSPNTFAPYPLAGLNPNMNVNSIDVSSGLSVKDSSQSQSRLPQWTHPNSMGNLSSAASPLDQNPSKHGAIPGGLSIGPPGKSSIDDSYGRYDLIQNSESPASPPVAVPHSWSRAKSDSDKISNGSSISWPPEFHPGVPWKGLQNIDPENDPDVTPGSVPTGPTINTTIQDVNRYLLKSGGSAWSTDASGRTSSWLVLRNLTPQIDGSTLRTLCLQHGPLITFHLNLTQGNAVVRYSSKEEAAKAQKSLHMCVLGNTTILAEFAGEEEVNRFLAQGQALPPTSSWQPSSGGSQPRLGSSGSTHGLVRSDTAHWSTPCLSGKGSSELLWGGVPQYSSSLWGPPSADDARVIGSPTPLNTLLPGDLLSGESM
ncbi:trinucleotide repeat-containingC protein [Cricetulus griseus]|uniref:Trinucleotide repeat-containing gene 6C protein n=1 Tax=Cricetulus griseus TaxID=10029 RepID=A0A061I2Z6_CRIGR|nr:trinucleotide repeat-containingC protein [Cricetulus griseus]